MRPYIPSALCVQRREGPRDLNRNFVRGLDANPKKRKKEKGLIFVLSPFVR
jgi:hypothetical protein